MFRWELLDDGRMLGVDGANYYLVELGSPLRVESNAGPEAFESLFRLDWDAADIERRIVRRGPELAPYMEGMRGLRVLRPSDPSETFFSFLCTPNNNVARITGMVRTLAAFGDPLAEVDGRTIHRFPSAEMIARIPEQELRERRFGYRAGTITRAAAEVARRGEAWLPGLKSASYDEAMRELLAIPGVGPKLADCIALFALDHTEAVPVDTHVWQQVVRIYRPDWEGKSLTPARYAEAGTIFRDRFGDLSGWAHQYLFYDNLLNWRQRRSPGM